MDPKITPFDEDLQAALGEWNSFPWNEAEREALDAEWYGSLHRSKSDPEKAREEIRHYATFLERRRQEPEENPVEAIEDDQASQVDDSAIPRSNLSEVKGCGQKGNPKFRTLCLRAAVKALKDAPFRLLAYLLSCGDSDGGNCFPSRRRTREDLDWSESKVYRCLKCLREEGWIELIRFMKKSGRHTSSLYRFRIPPSSMEKEEEWLEGALRWSQRVGVLPDENN